MQVMESASSAACTAKARGKTPSGLIGAQPASLDSPQRGGLICLYISLPLYMPATAACICAIKGDKQHTSGLYSAQSHLHDCSTKSLRCTHSLITCPHLLPNFPSRLLACSRFALVFGESINGVALPLQLCHRQRALLVHGWQRGALVEAHHLQGASGEP